jgi:hypothetical protein
MADEQIQVHWRLLLGRCVDAAPLVLALLAPQQQQQQQVDLPEASQQVQQQQQQQLGVLGTFVFACSHDGTVACVDVQSGNPCWIVQLTSRADAGMCLSPCARHVAVACGDTKLYCLAVATGAVQGSVECGGEVRAAPVTDPWGWCGCWWVVTHSRELLVVLPAKQPHIICRWVLSYIGFPESLRAQLLFIPHLRCWEFAWMLGLGACWLGGDSQQATGAVQGSAKCGGEVRAAPVTDPWGWCGYWWVVTHSRELLVVLPAEQPHVICRWVQSLPPGG